MTNPTDSTNSVQGAPRRHEGCGGMNTLLRRHSGSITVVILAVVLLILAAMR
jgi:hypothetical protein